jgi:5-formyltetrahydrofolate cyclo-ligase
MPDKATIRQQILEKRASLSPQALEKAGKTAAERLAAMDEYQRSKTIMVYMDFRNEVPTGPIIELIRSTGKKLILPHTSKDFLITPYEIPENGTLFEYLNSSGLGISEPNDALCKVADPDSIELVIIPGTVFDQYENRLGYGKGCYDRFLASLHNNAFKLALAYDFQVLPCIPAGPFDIKMDKILTIGTAHLE